MPDVIIVILVAVALLAATLGPLVIFLRAARRDHAAAGSAEAVTAVNGLPMRVNWRIGRAVRAGRAVEDPALARLAADRAAHAERVNDISAGRIRRYWWAYALLPLLFLVSIGLNLADDGPTRGNAFQNGAEILLVCWLLTLPTLLRRTARRAHAAAEANRAMAAQYPDATWTGPTLDPARTRLRRSVLIWAVGVAVLTPVTYVLFRLMGSPHSWPMTAVFTVMIMTAVSATSWYIAPTTGSAHLTAAND